jgi:hypothetical protein
MYEIPARICPGCGDMVWKDEPRVVSSTGLVYHEDCYKRVKERVETLTRHVRKTRQRVRNAKLTKAVSTC